MLRERRHLLIALAVAVALGAAVTMQIRHEKAQWQAPLTSLVAADIASIQLQCAACVAQRYERIDGVWWMREPVDQRADVERIRNLLGVASAAVRTRKSLAGLDLAKLGLAPAQAMLVFDGIAIRFGAFDSINGDRYVRVDNEDQIALVPDRFSPYLFAAPDSSDAVPPQND